jgi:hypothetical protein
MVLHKPSSQLLKPDFKTEHERRLSHELQFLSLVVPARKRINHEMPILVAALSNAWVCGNSLSGILGSNPAEVGMSAFVSVMF